MPTALTTINVAKEQAATYQPLLLAEFTFADGAVLRLSTHPLNTTEGGAQYGGNDYLGRISEQTIQQVQALSESGVDLIPSITLSIADPASYIYANWETAAGRGFRGASLTLRLVFYDAVGGTFSSDSRIPFVGICEKPASDAAKLTVTAVAKTSLMRAMLPIVPIQKRCPWINPTTTAQRAEASSEDSCFYECGETRDTGTAPPCEYTKATCTQLTRFGGITYAAPAGMRVREYTSGNWSDVRGLTNEAAYGDRIPMLYGQAWIEPPVLTAIPDGNYLRGECIVCLGQADILRVTVNGIELAAANEHDGTPLGAANPDFRYNWINDGTRDGSPNLEAPWSGDGDPYGSMTVIMFLLPRSQGGGDGVPRVRVLAKRRELRKYQALTSVTVTSNVAVATLVGANADIASNDPTWAFEIFSTTGAALNAEWTGLSDWTSGPPGTFTFTTSGVANGTYTGGYIRYKANTENVAWIIADLLTWTNYRYDDLDIPSFCAAAQVLESRPTALVLRQRRSAAEIIRSLRQAFGLLLVPEHSTGKLHLYVKQTLADQQPATISGSNYDTAVASKTAAGVTANGYVAYRFDAASILRSDLPISLKELSRTSSDSPNRLTVSFQDRANDYAISTLSVVDSDDAGRLDGQEVAGGLAATPEGLTSYDDAMRAARVSMAEIHRGNTAADTRGTRVFEWDTTVRGSHLRVGSIVLLTDTLKSLTNQMLRITKIQPAQNYETVRLTAHWHDDNWYTDAFAETGVLDATQYTPNPVSDASPLDLAGTVGTNLLKNHGFELGKSNWWGDIANAAITVITSTKDTGMACLKIAATTATEIHQPYEFQDGKFDVMPCVEGDAFTFRGRYKFDADSAASVAQARIAFYQADGTFISAATATLDPANTDWTDFPALSATAPALAKYMGIFPWFGTLTAGAVYLDTLYCAEASEAELPPGSVTDLSLGGSSTLTVRGQVLKKYIVAAKAPTAGTYRNFNKVRIWHTDENNIEWDRGYFPVTAVAEAEFEVEFWGNAPTSLLISESIVVAAANDYAEQAYADAATTFNDMAGVEDGAAPPSWVGLTIIGNATGQRAEQIQWTKPDPQKGTIGYELLVETYADVLGETVVTTEPSPGVSGYDVQMAVTSFKNFPAGATHVQAFVRAYNSYGQQSAWVGSGIIALEVDPETVVPQPGVSDWSLGTVIYGGNERVQRAGLPVNLIALPAGCDYVTAWLEIDGQYRDMLATATLGENVIWIDQPKTDTNYNCKLVGNRYDAVRLPTALNDVKTFSVAAWAAALELLTFTVELETLLATDSRNSTGHNLYRYKYTVTAPLDHNRKDVAVYSRWTDSSWVTVSGEAGTYRIASRGWLTGAETSLTWYSSDDYSFAAPKDGIQYRQFIAYPVNQAMEETTTDAIVVNVEFAPDGGFKATAIDPDTIGQGLTITATGIESLSRELQNGNFEAQGANWTYSAGVSFTTIDAFYGYAARLEGDGTGPEIYQSISVIQGQILRFEVYGRENGNSSSKARIQFYNAAGTLLSPEYTATISSDGYNFYAVVAAVPVTAATARVGATCPAANTSGRLLIDQTRLLFLEPTQNALTRGVSGLDLTLDAAALVVDGGQVTTVASGILDKLGISSQFTKAGGVLAVNSLAVNYLAAGTAVFTGDVVFSRSSGGSMTLNSSGVQISGGGSTLSLASGGAEIPLLATGSFASPSIASNTSGNVFYKTASFASGCAVNFNSGSTISIDSSIRSSWRTQLGLGTMATENIGLASGSFTVDGHTFTIVNGKITTTT